MTNEEFSQVDKLITFLLDTKNRILTFSFATVIGMYGFSFAKITDKDFYIYTIPFFLITPFAARVSYYRIWACYLETYLKIFANDKYVVSRLVEYNIPHIERNFLDEIMGILVNFEMAILCIACDIIFYYKCYNIFKFNIFHIIIFSIPTVSTLLVILFCCSALNYRKMEDNYIKKWKGLYELYNNTM